MEKASKMVSLHLMTSTITFNMKDLNSNERKIGSEAVDLMTNLKKDWIKRLTYMLSIETHIKYKDI